MSELLTPDQITYVPQNVFNGIDIDDPYGLEKPVQSNQGSHLKDMLHSIKDYMLSSTDGGIN